MGSRAKPGRVVGHAFLIPNSMPGNQNSAYMAGLADAEVGGARTINYDLLPSTAKPHHATQPRDLSEQVLWSQVVDNPSAGNPLPLGNDARFPATDGWQKMQANHTLPDNTNVTIHYQYNVNTNKAYDIKITTPQRETLQPGPSLIKYED